MKSSQNIFPSIGLAHAEELPEVHHFYLQCGYGGGISTSDMVLVARAGASLVGVVRLCVEQGIVVLRGMQVRAEYRRQGIGKRLLAAAIPHFNHTTCYCLPYSHLVAFYASQGFRVTDTKSLPDFLRYRLEGYLDEGQDVLAMQREPYGAGAASDSPVHPNNHCDT